MAVRDPSAADIDPVDVCLRDSDPAADSPVVLDPETTLVRSAS